MDKFHSVWETKDYGKVTLKLSETMDRLGVNRNFLMTHARTQFGVIDKWYDGRVEKMDLDLLARICFVLDCDIGDILEYERPAKDDR